MTVESPLLPEEDPADGTALEHERRLELEKNIRADRDFIHNGSRFMIVDNASKVLSPLLVLFCAKLYAGGEWGFFKYYESVLLLLTRLAAFGMDRGVVWIYGQRPGDVSFIRVFSRAANFVFGFAVLLALGAGAHWMGWIPGWSGFGHGAPGSTGFNIACFLASIPLQATTLLMLQALLNKRRLLPQAIVRNIAIPLATFGPAALMAFTPFKSHGLAVPYLFGSFLGFGLSLFYFLRAFPMSLREWSGSAKVPRDMIKFSLPLASTDFAMSLAYRMDILLLARFVGLQAVEVYSVIVMVANTLRSVRQSFDGIMLSVFSRGGKTLTREGRQKFNHVTWIVLSAQIPFFFLVLFFGRELLGLISPAYGSGQHTLLITLGFLVVIAPFGFSTQLLMGLGKTWAIPLAQALFFACTFGFNTLLIPHFGMEGAATATGISHLLSGLLCMGVLRWRLKTWVFDRPYFISVCIEAAIFTIPALVYLIWRPSLVVGAALFLAAGFAYWIYFRQAWKHFLKIEAGQQP